MSDSAAEAQGAEAARVESAPAAKPEGRRNVFARIALFVRQVVAELKKVKTPTRTELGQYTAIVLVFVVVVTAVIGVLDLGIGSAANWLFGA